MPVKRLKEFLDSRQVKYLAINHSLAYTAQEIAALTHIPENRLAKTVMVKIDGKMASYKDFESLIQPKIAGLSRTR